MEKEIELKAKENEEYLLVKNVREAKEAADKAEQAQKETRDSAAQLLLQT